MPLGRRAFLNLFARIVGAALFAPAAGRVALAASDAARLGNLSADEGQSLFKLTQKLFPHDGLRDEAYWQVVERLDAMAADPGFHGLISAGLAELDSLSGGAWRDLQSEIKLEKLRQLESGPFFQTVRILTLVSLYGNPGVAMQLGYEGSSFEFGGYLDRGFDDLDWLPDPEG